MDLEQAERFVAAAEHDYEMAVGWYCAMLEGKAEGPEDIVRPRADVLAAQQVLMLALEERRITERRAGEHAAVMPQTEEDQRRDALRRSIVAEEVAKLYPPGKRTRQAPEEGRSNDLG